MIEFTHQDMSKYDLGHVFISSRAPEETKIEVFKWCSLTFGNPYSSTNNWYILGNEYTFLLDRDAAFFKLRWRTRKALHQIVT